MDIDLFISRWTASGGSERANFQQFAIELTQLLGVDAPKPAASDAQNDDYRFERPVTFLHTGSLTRGYVDLYRARHFVMEAKQGVAAAAIPDQLSLPAEDPVQRQGHGLRGTRRWDDTMLSATPTQIAHRSTKVTPRSIQSLLEALTALGQARPLDQGRFAG